MDAIIWLALFVVLLIIEIITLGLTTIWFAGGALVAFIAAALGANLGIQLALFFMVSLFLLFVTRPIAVRYFNKDREKTNVDSLIGGKGVVLETIDNIHGLGAVSLNGKVWTARTTDNAVMIEKDEIITVKAIEGVKLIVEKIEKKTEESTCQEQE